MYKVELSPIIKKGQYADPIDITRFVDQRGLKKISQTVDSSDFSINRTTNSIRLTLINFNNIFSLHNNKSVFYNTRDESIITVSFVDDANKKTISFEGILDDSGTYEDEKMKKIKIVVASFEAVLKKYSIPQIGQGLTFSQAIRSILSLDEIAGLLSIREIETGIDFIIDDKQWLETQNVFRAINLLLIVSNSIMQINKDRSITIRPRNNRGTEVKKVFHGYHNKQRQFPMILEINSINTGIQRVFNFIRINTREIRNNVSETRYGLKETQDINIPFIDDESKERQIGEAILSGFLFAKEELEIKVLSQDTRDLELNDIVSIDFHSEVKPLASQEFLPLYGITKNAVFPFESGRIIPRALKWEIYEKNENPRDLNTVLKLRQL